MHADRMTPSEAFGNDIFSLVARLLLLAPETHAPARPAPADEPDAARAPARRGLLERLERWFEEQERRQIEAYLARSADVYDLEARMRAIERSGFPPTP